MCACAISVLSTYAVPHVTSPGAFSARFLRCASAKNSHGGGAGGDGGDGGGEGDGGGGLGDGGGGDDDGDGHLGNALHVFLQVRRACLQAFFFPLAFLHVL